MLLNFTYLVGYTLQFSFWEFQRPLNMNVSIYGDVHFQLGC